MNKKFHLFNVKFILSLLLILSIFFSLLGYHSLSATDYNISNYFTDFNLSNKLFKSTLNLSTRYFNYKLDFNLNDYRSSNRYDLRDDITELNFNFTSQNIEMIEDSGNTLTIDIDSDSSEDVELSLNKTDTKLFFNTKYNTPSKAKILIKIPKSFCDRGSIVLNTSSGAVSINNFRNHSLKINTAKGNINLSECITSYLYLTTSNGSILADNIYNSMESRITSTSGKIKMNGFLGTLTLTNTSGPTNLSLSDLNKFNSISTNTGHIKLYLPSKIGYKINYISSSGDFKSDHSLLSSGDESCKINIKTVSGNLSVSK